MNRLGELLHTNVWGDEIYGAVMGDVNSRKVYINIYIVSAEGKMSDLIKITRSDIYKKEKTCFDFMYDFSSFGRDDIDVVKNAVLKLVNNDSKQQKIQDKATLSELHEAVSRYIEENAEDLEDNDDAKMFIRDNFGYMTTACMEDFVKKNKELGYKRLEVLERLKIMGALYPTSNRPYDNLVSVNGKKRRCYKVELAGIKKEETVEKIEVKKIEVNPL